MISFFFRLRFCSVELPLLMLPLMKTENNVDESRRKSVILVFALPLLLCLRQVGFRGNLTDKEIRRT